MNRILIIIALFSASNSNCMNLLNDLYAYVQKKSPQESPQLLLTTFVKKSPTNSPDEHSFAMGPSAYRGYDIACNPANSADDVHIEATNDGVFVTNTTSQKRVAASLIFLNKLRYNANATLVSYVNSDDIEINNKDFGNSITIARSDCSELVCSIPATEAWGQVWHPQQNLIAFHGDHPDSNNVFVYSVDSDKRQATKQFIAGTTWNNYINQPCIAWSPVNPTILATVPNNTSNSAADLKTVALWDTPTHKLVASWFEASPKAQVTDVYQTVWDPTSGHLITACRDHSNSHFLSFHYKDGTSLGTVAIPLSNPNATPTVVPQIRNNVAAIIETFGTKISLIHTTIRKLLLQHSVATPIFNAYFSSNGKNLLVVESNTISIIDLSGTVKKKITLDVDELNTENMSINADESLLKIVQISRNKAPQINTYQVPELKS